MTSSWIKISLLAFPLALALGFSASAHLPGAPQTIKTARVVTNAPVPEFVLLDQEGAAFNSARLRGRVAVFNFIFTTCPDVCPLLTAKFAQLQRMLARDKKDVFLVSITTDPEVDTPQVLKAYAQRYGADFSTWAFLTGEEAKLKEVWRGFGVNVSKKGKGLVQHTGLTTLADRRGVRRVNYYGDTWREKDIFQDIEALRSEKQPARAPKN
ncbi:MAG TPA: SCO family protein [Candidatus Acidoferrales bacterium]|nr:SCO family protein [Candidatus Acidoferrales bacterium]